MAAISRVGRGGVSSAEDPWVVGVGAGDSPRVQVSEMQRARLLGAAVLSVEELGYTGATVAHITGRARISRRTFYDLFENREACLLGVLERIAAQLQGELQEAQLDDLPWRERVRMGLWGILCFFDREPALARFCVVQSARGSQRVLVYREELLARLAAVVDEGRLQGARAGDCPPLTAQALVGAAQSLLYTRLLQGGNEPLSDLLGELMGLIALPYLGSAAARRERTRPAPPRPAARKAAAAQRPIARPTVELPIRLTYRTARVLEVLAEYPGVSNRTVAGHVGITDQGQVSKLLARLERVGLLRNTGEGHTKGEPNAWQLTPSGRQVTESIRGNSRPQTANSRNDSGEQQ